MPILGVIASGISGHLVPPENLAYESIATVTVGAGGSATAVFSSIPQTYQHLQIRGTATSTAADAVLITFNGDSGSNYSRTRLASTGSAVGASGGGTTTFWAVGSGFGFSTTTSNSGMFVADIHDYANTNKTKSLRGLMGYQGGIEFDSGNWLVNTAISSITLTMSGGSWKQYSSFALYGIK